MGKQFRLSASGRRKDKEVSAIGFNDLFLAVVKKYHDMYVLRAICNTKIVILPYRDAMVTRKELILYTLYQ